MISLAEKPRPIEIKGEEWADAPTWMDKNYIFKHNGFYYLSWGRDYAISENIYGPYETVGAAGTGHYLDEYAHGSFFWWKGQFYHMWCYYIDNKYKYRETIMTYCHFDKDGRIVTDMNYLGQHFKTGVGQYDTTWVRTQAEWFYEKSPNVKKESYKRGFELNNIKSGDWVRFSNMKFVESRKKMALKVANTGQQGTFEIRLDSPDGLLLDTIEIQPSSEYKVVHAKFKKLAGKRDLYLVAKGENTSLKLDWFYFY